MITRNNYQIFHRDFRRKFNPPASALRLAYKDVALGTAQGGEYIVPMPVANQTLQELMTAMNRGWGDKDASMAIFHQEERAGLSIPTPGKPVV